MKITGSSMAMRSTHAHASSSVTETSVRVWNSRGVVSESATGPARRQGPATPPPVTAPAGTGQTAASGDATEPTDRIADDDERRLATLIAMVEKLTGVKIRVPQDDDAGAARPRADLGPQAQAALAADRGGWGGEISTTVSTAEVEATAVAIDGSVTTADGRTINFDLDVELYRQAASSVQATLSFGAEEPKLKDPLALSFGGAAPSLTADRADLDLDGDGSTEAVPFVGDGLAYLAIDKNGNGAVDGGSELFGPATGDGFAELADYDSDRNGWIDEADPAFAKLRLWSSPEGPLQTLAERGVGAIAVGSVQSPFQLRSGSGELQGVVRASGVWLAENGQAGAVHQIDVVT